MPKIFKSEKGQALTEFAVAFPLVMLVFLIGMQMLFAANCVNVGHYAAFAAARSYSVTAGAGPGGEDNAELKAELAAAMVYMPVSIPAKGEVDDAITSLIQSLISDLFSQMFGDSGSGGGITDLFDSFVDDPGGTLLDFIQDGITGGMNAIMDTLKNAIINEVKSFVMDSAVDLFSQLFGGAFDDLTGANGSNPGFKLATAYFRLGFLTQGIDITEDYPDPTNGNKKADVDQFTVNLHYRLPMAMPGFKSFWNMVRGYSIDEAFDKEDDDPLKTHYESGLNNAIFIIHTKCTMGYERWSGVYAGAPEKNKKRASGNKGDTAKKRKCFEQKQSSMETKSKRIKRIEDTLLPQARSALTACRNDPDPDRDCTPEQNTVNSLISERDRLKGEVEDTRKSIRKDCDK